MPTKKTTTPIRKSPKPSAKEGNTATFQAELLDVATQKKDTFELSSKVFGQPINKQLLAQYMHVYLTNQRQGTVRAKTRSEVVGSTRKIYRQKGTGGARHGARKAPIFVGGGVSHGPRPRTFDLKINSKVVKKALYMALSDKVTVKKLYVLKEASKIKPKTKDMMDVLKSFGLNNAKSTLIICGEGANNVVLASRNIHNVILKNVKFVNAYDIVRAQTVLVDTESIQFLQS